ncbi:S-adenosyl-L-methionine-dependent methyltransferase [Fimicolochytrium jonesii]|uniref:S-adenosyl-L-methionine-dependent methyltransferase n=1 Tax=Fimicolochytrium jonesii TaxID=1396493 RepID=UPI0022FE7DB7|nr:S-adenosyl-L-methionine-dependent methyltransferase [Fimicolochytrium jonesii]KAI8825912.1 S-adenosyl-L-methionine-dependent methyltransferase [Fimicolochytrium jonesii]
MGTVHLAGLLLGLLASLTLLAPPPLLTLLLGILTGLLLSTTQTWDTIRLLLSKLPLGTSSATTTDEHGGYAYGMDHALLNLQPPATFWLNMGLWKSVDKSDFVGACRALAQVVIDGLELKDGDRVFDFGYGCGDQLLLLLSQHPHTIVTGVTSESAQALLAASRLPPHTPTTALYIGDAVNPSSWRKPANSNIHHVPKPDQTYDAILSLDSCYHYTTRLKWLHLCHQMLKPNGRFSCTDLQLGPGYARAVQSSRISDKVMLLKLRAALYLTGAPWANFLTPPAYIGQYHSAGFTDVVVEDISANVFPGLGRFIKAHRERMGGVVGEGKWGQYEMAGRLFGWLWEEGLVRFVVVRARRG